MATNSSRSPARSGLVGATAVFGLLLLVGVGWMLHEGRLDALLAQMPAWSTASLQTPASGADSTLSLLDQQTQSHAERGAVVAIGRFIDGNHVQLDQTVFRYWGVWADSGFSLCEANRYGWTCGTRADQALASYTQGGLVACYDRGVASNGERLGQCFRGVIDLGGMLVENGFATEVPEETANYHVKQAWAKDHRAGVWANPQ